MEGICFGCITPHPPLLIPDVGKGQERTISATIDALDNLADLISEKEPQTAMIISPHGDYHMDSMGILASPTCTGDMDNWGSREPKRYFDNDMALVELIRDEAKQANIPLKSIGENGYKLDQGVMVPMHFLYPALHEANLVPLTFSWLPLSMHYEFGRALSRAVKRSGKRVVLVASGDLSHRLIPEAPAGYDPMGKVFDEMLVKAVSEMDVDGILHIDRKLVERAGECGLRSVVILMGALDGLKVKPKVHSYEGPFGVGYMVASFDAEP
jgi:aromatic ring-opening dioxygenase LigB subunit